MFVAAGDNVVVDEMSSEVGEPLGVLGRDDDLDALELLGGRLGHDALRAVATYPEPLGCALHLLMSKTFP